MRHVGGSKPTSVSISNAWRLTTKHGASLDSKIRLRAAYVPCQRGKGSTPRITSELVTAVAAETLGRRGHNRFNSQRAACTRNMIAALCTGTDCGIPWETLIPAQRSLTVYATCTWWQSRRSYGWAGRAAYRMRRGTREPRRGSALNFPRLEPYKERVSKWHQDRTDRQEEEVDDLCQKAYSAETR